MGTVMDMGTDTGTGMKSTTINTRGMSTKRIRKKTC